MLKNVDNFAIVLYSHTDYKDVWLPMLDSLQKYFSNVYKYFFLNDKSECPDGFECVEYQDNVSYTQRLYSCLEMVEEDVVLFLHEDMWLIKQPEYDKIDKIIKLVEKKYNFVKLIKSEPGPDIKLDYNFLNLITSDLQYKFSIQPTIWDTVSLMNLINSYDTSIWDFETKIQWDHKLNKMLCGYTHTDEPKRGMFHYDSHIFPYIATAIVKGKWNTLEYEKEIKDILNKFNIDINIRGEYEG